VIESLFFLVALISVAFCFRPFFRSNLQVGTNTTDTPLGRLYQRKETLLQNIADLDFEYNMGKLAEEDFTQLRNGLKVQAMETMEQIELLEESEAMVEGRREGRRKSHVPATPTRSCSACGEPLPPVARFCPGCGARVEEA